MTEQRVSYTALSRSNGPEHKPIGENHHHGHVLLSLNRVLLVPFWQSTQVRDDPALSPCLHLIRLGDAHLGLCNTPARHTCACCACPVCTEHQSGQWLSLPDVYGLWSEEDSRPLCATCALLPKEMLYALHAFRMTFNQQQGVGQRD